MKPRKGRDGKADKPDRYVQLRHWVLNTDAWQALNGNERAIYVDIAKRYAGQGSNNGRIPYAVRDATKALPIGLATAHRGIRRLQELGFIVCTMKGAFKASRDASTWRLTEFVCDVTGELPTKDFTRWGHPKKQNPVSETELNGSCGGTVRYLRRNSETPKVASR